MDLKYFPNFFRIAYPKLNNNISDDQLIEIGRAFKEYLENTFKNNMDKLEPIWDINPVNVIKNFNHPLKMKGYHPALLIHFQNFILKAKQELEKKCL